MNGARLRGELKKLRENKVNGIRLIANEDNLFDWTCILDGPDGTPYQGGTYVVKQPLQLLEAEGKYDIKANLDGGGFTGQSQALRLAIARALVKIDANDKKALKDAGFMTRDSRAVERKKPGQPKARRRFQFSKR